MVIVWGSFSVFSPHRMRVSGIVFLCIYACIRCGHVLRLHRLHLISMGFEAFAHGHFYNLFFFLLRYALSSMLFSFFICFGCDPTEGHLLSNFPLWIICIVQAKCQHESKHYQLQRILHGRTILMKTHALNSIVTTIYRKPWKMWLIFLKWNANQNFFFLHIHDDSLHTFFSIGFLFSLDLCKIELHTRDFFNQLNGWH